MLRTERTRRVRKERGPASGIAAGVLVQAIRRVGFSKEVLLAGGGRKQLLRCIGDSAYAVFMTRNTSRRKSGNGLSAAIGDRVIREVRHHVSREVKSATKRLLKAVKANAKGL